MKSLLVISLLVLGMYPAASCVPCAGLQVSAGCGNEGAHTSSFPTPWGFPSSAQCCERPSQKGRCVKFTNMASNLDDINFSDKIASVRQTGMWIYYENAYFNAGMTGKVYFSFGAIQFNFPLGHRNLIHSLRPVKVPPRGFQTCIAFFDGTHLTDELHAWCDPVKTFGKQAAKFKSFLLVGKDPWTLYSKVNWKGLKKCVYPNVEHPNASIGVFVNMTMLGFGETTVRSGRRGCHSTDDVPHISVKLKGRAISGGWGRLR